MITKVKSLKIEIILASAMLIIFYNSYSSLVELKRRWVSEDAYSHAPILILFAAYIIYDKRQLLNLAPPKNTWIGPLLLIATTLVYIIGELSALFILSHYSIIASLVAIFICRYGVNNCRHIWPAIVLLIFSIPLPYFLQSGLTAQLQLFSSYIAVAIIKLFSVPAYLEGNVIDLGIIKLQVVEACAGLKYLFSLMSFGFICAYVYQVETWKRVIVFLSTIPITILMNSFRIAIGAILVNHIGIEMAEGFIHEFQGLSVFIICLIILFIEMWVLTKIGTQQRPFREVFGLDFSQKNTQRNQSISLSTTISVILALSIIGISSFFIHLTENRQEYIPEHTPLATFSLNNNQWQGNNIAITSKVSQKLQFNDYLQINYRKNNTGIPVVFYTAYYASQKKGVSPHSPKVCIPGGGWEITSLTPKSMKIGPSHTEVQFNRAIIQKDQHKQLVYYWFQQRGRYIANEYLVKWYLLKDSIFNNRSDGSLVRLVTPIATNETEETADQRLLQFSNEVAYQLKNYLPN